MPKRALFILSLAVFSTMMGNSLVIPFLPLYVRQFGVSEFGAGLLFSVHAATRILILPFIGRLSDRWERKRFLLVGVLCYTLASIAYMPAGTLTSFVLIMVMHGTATAVVHPVAMAYVGDLAPKGQEGTYSGYLNTALLGGVAGGPLIGGVIKDFFSMETNFLAMAGLSLFSLLLMVFFLPRVESDKAKGHSVSASVWSLFSCRPILGAACFRFAYALTNTLTWVFLPLLATHLLPLSTTQIGFLISANVMVSAFLQAPCGRLADRINKARLIGVGGLAGAVVLAAFPLATGFGHLLLLNILVGVAYGLAFPAHVALAMENARSYGMGTVMSLLMLAHGVGMMIGPVLFGSLASRFTLGCAFWGGGVIAGLLTVASYPLMRDQRAAMVKLSVKEREAPAAD